MEDFKTFEEISLKLNRKLNENIRCVDQQLQKLGNSNLIESQNTFIQFTIELNKWYDDIFEISYKQYITNQVNLNCIENVFKLIFSCQMEMFKSKQFTTPTIDEVIQLISQSNQQSTEQSSIISEFVGQVKQYSKKQYSSNKPLNKLLQMILYFNSKNDLVVTKLVQATQKIIFQNLFTNYNFVIQNLMMIYFFITFDKETQMIEVLFQTTEIIMLQVVQYLGANANKIQSFSQQFSQSIQNQNRPKCAYILSQILNELQFDNILSFDQLFQKYQKNFQSILQNQQDQLQIEVRNLSITIIIMIEQTIRSNNPLKKLYLTQLHLLYIIHSKIEGNYQQYVNKFIQIVQLFNPIKEFLSQFYDYVALVEIQLTYTPTLEKFQINIENLIYNWNSFQIFLRNINLIKFLNYFQNENQSLINQLEICSSIMQHIQQQYKKNDILNLRSAVSLFSILFNQYYYQNSLNLIKTYKTILSCIQSKSNMNVLFYLKLEKNRQQCCTIDGLKEMIQFLHFQLKETFWPTFKNQIFDDDSIDSSFQQSQYDLYDFSDSKQQINDSKVYNENNSYNHFSKNNENLLEINQSQILKPQKNYSNLTITDNKENLYFLNKPMKNWSTIECYEWIQSWGFNDEIIDLIKNIGMDGAELIELTPKKMQLQLKIQDIDIQTKLLSLIHYTNFKILNQKK